MFGAAFECADADRADFEVDIYGSESEDLGESGAGMRQRECEGLLLGFRLAGCGCQEPLSFLPGQIFPAPPVDELDRALDHE